MDEKIPKGFVRGEDGNCRCRFGNQSDVYQLYHDCEWGVPEDDDIKLFEKICLSGFQGGLSWLTILKKREHFRAAFDGFDFSIVSKYTAKDVSRLMTNRNIVRHRRKIESTINNAIRAVELKKECGSLAAFFWGFEPPKKSRTIKFDADTLLKIKTTAESEAMSRALKDRGWTFIGPITTYAFMQAKGIVNDHVEGCDFRGKCEHLRRDFDVPKTRSVL